MRVAEPASEDELRVLLESEPNDSYLPTGNQRSYGDQGVLARGIAISSANLNRVESFDPSSGILVAQAGCTFRQLVDRYVPEGYLVPVSPGTGFATLGGALANDVHGKNHDRDGGFGDHVEWFDILCANGELLRVSDETDPALFRATIGGCGLTGFVVRMALRMKPVQSNAVDLVESRARNLEEFIDLLHVARSEATYSVGWIDALRRGKHLGRGVVETARFGTESVTTKAANRFRMPLDAPSFALSRFSVAAFNELYFRRVPAAGRRRTLHVNPFFYPLDAILDWNRIYGSRGFYQFQCVVSDDVARPALREMLLRISASGGASFLAVLKTLGRNGRGYLSFPRRGFTLALDFPRTAPAEQLLVDLEVITLSYGGRVYLAKDGWLSAHGFAQMYPKLDSFRQVLQRVDPQQRFDSDMARRLKIRGSARAAARSYGI